MPRYSFVVACLGILALSAPNHVNGQTPATAALRTEIQQVVRAYIDAHNRADVPNIVEMYSREAGVTSVGDGDIYRGWDRIREYYDEAVGLEGKLRISIGSIDVTPLGPGYALALTSYTVTVNVQGLEVQQRGAMTLVFQKTGSEWKVIHDHTSTKQEEGMAKAGGGQGAAAPAAIPAAPAAAPTTVPIAAGRASEVQVGNYLYHTFSLPPSLCEITGRVEGIAGGNKDFEAFIMDDDNLRNWAAGLSARAHWQSGRVTVATIDAQVEGPGTFYLVVSNVFSDFTPKTVQVWAQAEC